MKKLIWYPSFLVAPLTIVSLTTITSCSNTSSAESIIKNFQQIQTYLKDSAKKNFSKPAQKVELEGIKTIVNEEMATFKSEIQKYLVLDPEFKAFLEKDNDLLFKSISKLVISPQPNTKNVKVILINSLTDTTTATVEIKDYLDQNFTYDASKTIEIKKIIFEPQVLESKEEFDKQLMALKEKQDLTLLKKGFELDTTEEAKIKTNFAKLDILDSSFKITLKIKPEAIDEGFVFKYQDDYQGQITSNILAKDK